MGDSEDSAATCLHLTSPRTDHRDRGGVHWMNLLRGRVIVLCVNNNGFFRPNSKKLDMSYLNSRQKSANYELKNPHHPKHVECADRKKTVNCEEKNTYRSRHMECSLANWHSDIHLMICFILIDTPSCRYFPLKGMMHRKILTFSVPTDDDHDQWPLSLATWDGVLGKIKRWE